MPPPQVFTGLVEVQDNSSVTTISLDGDAARVAAGGGGPDGNLYLSGYPLYSSNAHRHVWS